MNQPELPDSMQEVIWGRAAGLMWADQRGIVPL
jgi:hypothetical protein